MKDIIKKYIENKPKFYVDSFKKIFKEDNIRDLHKLYIKHTKDDIINEMSSYEKTRLYFLGLNRYTMEKINEDLDIKSDLESIEILSNFDKNLIIKYCYIMKYIEKNELKELIFQKLTTIYNCVCCILEIKIDESLLLN